MRGDRDHQGNMLLGTTPDELVPRRHPIREIKAIVEASLTELSPVFNKMYAKVGRASIPPERLLKSSLLIALYSIRSERQFCERLQYDLLFKWFLDMNISEPSFDASSFSKNKERLLEHEVAGKFFETVLAEARRRDLLSEEHFTVDGTLLEAWASIKSFRPKGDQDDGEGPPATPGGRDVEADFRGERLSNQTHSSTTDPEARLARKSKGREARLSFAGHVLMENRTGLVVETALTQASGISEADAALAMLSQIPGSRRITVGADKGYDSRRFIDGCWRMNITPHVAQRAQSAIDGRTTRHAGYWQSQKVRKRVEEIFGWIKTVGGGRKLRHRGVERNRLWMEITATAYNLIRMAKHALSHSDRPEPVPVR